MSELRQVLLGGALLLITATVQAVEISGYVTLATDYVYRGISQTSEGATAQGGFDITADSGLYAGIWGSNVSFDGSVEIDYFVGFSNEVFEGFGYDVGLIHYDYPNQDPLVPVNAPTLAKFIADVENYPAGLVAAVLAARAAAVTADPPTDPDTAEAAAELVVQQAFYDATFGAPGADTDYDEIYFNVTYRAFTVGLSYSNDFSNETDGATYVYGEYELALPSEFALVLHYGSQGISDAPGYDEFSISLSKEIADIGFTLSYHDTDINGVDDARSRVVFAMSKNL